jgi:hypothetical protein
MEKILLALELVKKYNKISFEDFVEELERHNGIEIETNEKKRFIFSGLDNVSYFVYYIKMHNDKNNKQLSFRKALELALELIAKYNELRPIDAMAIFAHHSNQLMSPKMVEDFPLSNTDMIESDYLNKFNIEYLYRL